ncbi:MAG: ADP-ribosylglycohydrolase family protein [Verrucomicrobiales bacterium]|nr:ADP-ribosylglycohydrolase family protein [Verrucomicrobiales bacterium]
MNARLFRSILVAAWLASLSALAADPSRVLSRAELMDRIRGGWAGQMIGVAYGAPTEFKSNGAIGEWDLVWKPEMLANAIEQDDLYVEMTFARVMDTQGLRASLQDYALAFRDSRYPLWHANAAARRLLNLGVRAPRSGDPRFNIHANDIDFQIEADFIGLMAPGLPNEARRFCHRIGRVMNSGEGLDGGVFVCGMIATAYFEKDIRRIVEAGVECLPAESAYARIIRDVLAWTAEQPEDWRAVWQRLDTRWNRDDVCPDGAHSAFNIDAKLNGAYVALGLLAGGGDFRRTMEIATRCGQDSDCNPSSAAGVLGVRCGLSGIPSEFAAPLPALAQRKFLFTEYSFDDIVRSTEARALTLIRQAGGTVNEREVRVPVQTPRPGRSPGWNSGIPEKRLGVTDPAWTWRGGWREASGESGRQSAGAGAEAVLVFEGTGVAVLAQLDKRGGRADVYLDGRRVGMADAYVADGTYDNGLWHVTGLKSGRHELRLVHRADADSRAQGTRLSLTEALVYRAPEARRIRHVGPPKPES